MTTAATMDAVITASCAPRLSPKPVWIVIGRLHWVVCPSSADAKIRAGLP